MSKNPKAEAPPQRPKRTDPSVESAGDPVLQQRLVEAQVTISRDYTRLRELEARHRHLFDSAEAILVVEADGLRIVDSNPAAASLLSTSSARLNGSPLASVFDAGVVHEIDHLGAAILRGGKGDAVRLPATDTRPAIAVSGWSFRQDGIVVLLLRLALATARPSRADRDARDDARDELASYAVGAPDGVVLTDLNGRILQANAAFVELVQLATERQVRGESLGRWLGTHERRPRRAGHQPAPARHAQALLDQPARRVRQRDRGRDLRRARVGRRACVLRLHDPRRRSAPPGETHARDDLSKSVGQLAELVGRVPLKEIVGNTAGLIEKMCIEAALQLTRDNRAAAAELLGLSRQSLYVKLRRYGMGDLDNEEQADADA